MESGNQDAPRGSWTLEDAIDGYLRSAAKNGETGTYRKRAEHVLRGFRVWMAHRDVESLERRGPDVMRQYARDYLSKRVNSDAIAASTAHTNWSIVRAFLTWCVWEGILSENPAKRRKAEDELPDRPERRGGDQQFWSPENRTRLMRHLNERAHEAIDEDGTDAHDPVRDRALCALLAYTGVRGGEFLSVPSDDRRDGLRWRDVHVEDRRMVVRGKSQDQEDVPLPDQAVGPLKQYRRVLNPPSEDWPVFPTRHAPTLYSLARDELEDAEDVLDDADVHEVIREYDIAPPAITTQAGRDILKRLTDEACIENVDGDKDYLTLHGARRGVGERLYRDRGAAAAQRMLRHADPATTSQMYSHIEAGEQAEDATRVFEDEG